MVLGQSLLDSSIKYIKAGQWCGLVLGLNSKMFTSYVSFLVFINECRTFNLTGVLLWICWLINAILELNQVEYCPYSRPSATTSSFHVNKLPTSILWAKWKSTSSSIPNIQPTACTWIGASIVKILRQSTPRWLEFTPLIRRLKQRRGDSWCKWGGRQYVYETVDRCWAANSGK